MERIDSFYVAAEQSWTDGTPQRGVMVYQLEWYHETRPFVSLQRDGRFFIFFAAVVLGANIIIRSEVIRKKEEWIDVES